MVRTALIPVMLVILCLTAISCDRPQTSSSLDIAAPVTVQPIVLKPIEEFITTTGTVEAAQTFDIKTETQGFYHLGTNPRTKAPFAPGDEVKKDDVIVTLESEELVNSVNIESRKLNLDLNQRELDTQKSLYEKGGVTLRELRTAERSLIDAQNSYQNALIQLARLKIQIPFDGILTDVTYYTPGIKIASGSAAATVKNYTRLTMDVNFPAKQLGRIREGLVVRVSNVNIPGRVFPGRVVDVSPSLDPTTRNFKASVRVENGDRSLKPGMFVKVEIVVERHDNVVVIPKDVIISRRQDKSVYIVERGIAVQRRITTGIENPTDSEITDGLAENDRLVVKGFETLRDRAKVKVTE